MAVPAPSDTTVLITGTSSGIGRMAVLAYLEAGYRTIATARRLDSISDLRQAGAEILELDVTDESSMVEAVNAAGGVDVLVNNAGYSHTGVIEQASLDGARQQFETNYFGLVRMIQLVLPHMRERGWGRILNVSSMGGRMVFPGGGHYHASKFAVEAMSDALRYEVRPFGVDVILIEPGLVITEFGNTARQPLAEGEGTDGPELPYAAFNAEMDRIYQDAYNPRSFNARFAWAPERVAGVMVQATQAARPKNRYLLGIAAKQLVWTRELMGARIFDKLVGTRYPQAGPGPRASRRRSR